MPANLIAIILHQQSMCGNKSLLSVIRLSYSHLQFSKNSADQFTSLYGLLKGLLLLSAQDLWSDSDG